jgi:hypothetical protein
VLKLSFIAVALLAGAAFSARAEDQKTTTGLEQARPPEPTSTGLQQQQQARLPEPTSTGLQKQSKEPTTTNLGGQPSSRPTTNNLQNPPT